MAGLINVDEARQLAGIKQEITDLDKHIRKAATAGEVGVWSKLSELAYTKLKERGYELTCGTNNFTEKGDDRRGQYWIWWGPQK